jgi:hypothetical protein
MRRALKIMILGSGGVGVLRAVMARRAHDVQRAAPHPAIASVD